MLSKPCLKKLFVATEPRCIVDCPAEERKDEVQKMKVMGYQPVNDSKTNHMLPLHQILRMFRIPAPLPKTVRTNHKA